MKAEADRPLFNQIKYPLQKEWRANQIFCRSKTIKHTLRLLGKLSIIYIISWI